MTDKLFAGALCALALTVAIPLAHADGPGGRMAVYDRGQDSCGQLIQARRFDPRENSVYAVWLAGYLTAYNQLTPTLLTC